jgi:phosphate transport system substrate-binding protein
MKTIEKKISNLLATYISGYIWKAIFINALMIYSFIAVAQNAIQTITISGSKFANPLIGKWTEEYTKANPDIAFKFVKSSDKSVHSDLNLTVNANTSEEGKLSENFVNVGRLAILPVANVNNTLFPKQLKNGFKQDELKNLFLKAEFDLDTEPTKEPLYTVYTQTPQSATAQVLINHFGQFPSELNGVIVTGDDKYLIESILGDPTGVTYGNLSLIYDLNSREPLKGIKILPIDPDNSGRLKKEELVYDNLDQLITFLESSKNKSIPTDDISLSYDKNNNNPLVADFVNWVKISGQQFNHQYGFLRTNDKESVLTQK